MRLEHGHRGVNGVHANLMFARTKVQLGEETRPLQFVEEFINDQYRKFVFERLFIQGSVVNAESP